jgi:hypothetical protein
MHIGPRWCLFFATNLNELVALILALACFASPYTEGMCPLLIGLRPPPGYCFSSGARLARDPNGLPSTGTPVRLRRFPAL